MFYRAAGSTSDNFSPQNIDDDIDDDSREVWQPGRRAPRRGTQFTVSIFRRVASDSGTVQKENKLTSCSYLESTRPALKSTGHIVPNFRKHRRPIPDSPRSISLVDTRLNRPTSYQIPAIAARNASELLGGAYEAGGECGFRDEQHAVR